jgi:hypothetical protein
LHAGEVDYVRLTKEDESTITVHRSGSLSYLCLTPSTRTPDARCFEADGWVDVFFPAEELLIDAFATDRGRSQHGAGIEARCVNSGASTDCLTRAGRIARIEGFSATGFALLATVDLAEGELVSDGPLVSNTRVLTTASALEPGVSIPPPPHLPLETVLFATDTP